MIDTVPSLVARTGSSVANAVELLDVRKRFGNHNALDGMTLTIPEGRITVLLGPNGAGKTTAIRVVTGAMPPDGGSVTVLGTDPAINGEEVRRRCGVVSAKPALYDRLDGWDNLAYAAALYGVTNADAAINEAAGRFGIDKVLRQKVGGFSTGMKTRLALARSVLHSPSLLLLDEPTSGLDPESSYAVLGLIRDMTSSGATVLMCTHLLAEAEGLADQLVVLEDGKDLAFGAPRELMAKWWPVPRLRLAADGTDLGSLLGGRDGILGVSIVAPGVVDLTIDDLARVADLVAYLVGAGVRLQRVEPLEPSLEDLYFAVRGVTRGAMTTVEVTR